MCHVMHFVDWGQASGTSAVLHVQVLWSCIACLPLSLRTPSRYLGTLPASAPSRQRRLLYILAQIRTKDRAWNGRRYYSVCQSTPTYVVACEGSRHGRLPLPLPANTYDATILVGCICHYTALCCRTSSCGTTHTKQSTSGSEPERNILARSKCAARMLRLQDCAAEHHRRVCEW